MYMSVGVEMYVYMYDMDVGIFMSSGPLSNVFKCVLLGVAVKCSVRGGVSQ